MSNSTSTPEERIYSIVLGFWQARALAVATELGLADLLGDRSMSTGELASRTGSDVSALFRLLRALESVGIFVEVSPGYFSNTPMSNCLRKGLPDSQWATVEGQPK